MKLIVKLVVIFIFVATISYAWNDEKTHPTLSEFAAEKYFGADSMDEIVNDSKARYWIRQGSKLEDTGSLAQFVGGTARSLNHFHNASKATLAEARLTDVPSFIPIDASPTWTSTLIWAQDSDNQATKVSGDWSWSMVRYLYYKSLTTSDKSLRELWEADYLKGLGYQMHLIQDMGQPNHVRNDTHVADGASWLLGLETWARVNNEYLQGYLQDLWNGTLVPKSFPIVTVNLKAQFVEDTSRVPVANLFDTRGYKGARAPTAAFNQGLAEYTNSNFFSESTVFAAEYPATDKHYQPYPVKSETNVQDFINKQLATTTVTDNDFGTFEEFIITKQNTNGEKLNCIATAGPFSSKLYQEGGEDQYFYRSFWYEDCFKEYVEKLIPASAAYSIEMLKYFHRGKLTVSLQPGDLTFGSVKLNITNDTPDEALGTGDLTVVFRYKALPETDMGGNVSLVGNPAESYSYKTATIAGADLANNSAYTIDFSGSPLPLNFSDMSMQVVYKGKLGFEPDSVAVSPWTPVDGIYTDLGISLPASGIYAKASDNTLGATFNELRLNVLTNMPGGLSGGTFQLALGYRIATSDQFQSIPVDTEPIDAIGYLYRAGVKNGVTSLSQGEPAELVFDLSALPVSATDVEINLIYTTTDGKQIIGYHDISEPTPVDAFNNTDYSCIETQWYISGTPEARAAADLAGNQNGFDDDMDTYPHSFTDIYANISSTASPIKASATAFDLLDAGPVTTNSLKRMGYVLTDYSFQYSFLKNWVHIMAPQDGWTMDDAAELHSGAGFVNQANMGYSLMYSMRGQKMWGGAGFVMENFSPAIARNCDWQAIPQ